MGRVLLFSGCLLALFAGSCGEKKTPDSNPPSAPQSLAAPQAQAQSTPGAAAAPAPIAPVAAYSK